MHTFSLLRILGSAREVVREFRGGTGCMTFSCKGFYGVPVRYLGSLEKEYREGAR